MYPFSMLELGLWVGGQPELKHLRHQIDAVVNLRRELLAHNYPPNIKELVWLPIEDLYFPGVEWLDAAASHVCRLRACGRNTLVHCALGISRSVMVASAYLMKSQGLSDQDAIARIQRARPQADPSGFFREGLAQYDAHLRSKRVA